MNKKILFYLLIFLCSFSLTAQKNKESRDKIKALKIAYLTEQLNLTTTEAQKFWPIYNSFDKKQREIRYRNRGEIKKLVSEKGSIDKIDDKEAERLILAKLNNDKDLYLAQKEFVYQLKNIISHKKILKLQIAEMEFGRKLMRKYRERK